MEKPRGKRLVLVRREWRGRDQGEAERGVAGNREAKRGEVETKEVEKGETGNEGAERGEATDGQAKRGEGERLVLVCW